jgi:hypothetical protein
MQKLIQNKTLRPGDSSAAGVRNIQSKGFISATTFGNCPNSDEVTLSLSEQISTESDTYPIFTVRHSQIKMIFRLYSSRPNLQKISDQTLKFDFLQTLQLIDEVLIFCVA